MAFENLNIIAMGAYGSGISGGDRIFIEVARRLRRVKKVNIYVWEEGKEMCKRQGLTSGKNLKIVVWKMGWVNKLGFVVCYAGRIVKGIWESLFLKIADPSLSVVYSASEFWMDVMPAFIIKIRYPKVKWVAAWFQTAPKPWQGFSEGKREKTYKVSAFYYWIVQMFVKPIISYFSDIVLVNNEAERKQFSKHNKDGSVVVMLGGVNVTDIKRYRLRHKKNEKKFDAVFQGRFHPQKGVVELIDVWRMVVNRKPNAKLAMIGDGPLMDDVKGKIKKERLGKNVALFGYVFEGSKKYEIFSQSKLVCHPAFFDSGGMASAEAMAFGVPAVGFDLSAYKSYYPKGMVKVKIGDLKMFSDEILRILNNNNLRNRLGDEARKMIEKDWSWENRVDSVFDFINK
ncbi:MAG TPA: glycosyltransferase [Patescibacteria group bacterium]